MREKELASRRFDPILRRRRTEWLVSLPTLAWLTLFVVIPTLLVFVIAFRPANPYGGIGRGWTLDTIRALATPSYLLIAWRTLWISLLTTAICLLLALPAGYTIARAPERWRNRLLLLRHHPLLDELSRPRLRLEIAPPP